MHQSSKEKTILKPENRILHNDVRESVQMLSPFQDIECAEEWHIGPEQVQRTPRKTYR